MKRLLVGLAAFGALGAAAPAHASIPMPWCGTSSSAVDRLPDATPGFAVHAVYARAQGVPDRFGELAPRIVGDVVAMEAWWRSQDATRSPRFDLFSGGCATAFGTLDITNVELPQAASGVDRAFNDIRLQLGSLGLNEPEKIYLVYYDGSTGQSGSERICGQGAQPRGSAFSGMAVIYLDSCRATEADALRPVVAIHELVHVLGAVDDDAPHVCNDGHVCDVEEDLLAAFLSDDELEAHVLDGGRDDYYGHSGSWTDVQDSLFLERLDSPDRTPPSPITGLIVRTDTGGLTFVEWQPAQDESQIVYRVKLDGQLVDDSLTYPVAEASPQGRRVLVYTVQAADAVGHLGPPSTIRFAPGRGIVDASGLLVRDTVPPSAVKRVRVEKARPTVTLRWAPATDGVALRGYRIKFGTRRVNVVRPAITISRSRLRNDVQITAVDRAGNLGPTTFVPLSRLR